jgi:hypothetical protein
MAATVSMLAPGDTAMVGYASSLSAPDRMGLITNDHAHDSQSSDSPPMQVAGQNHEGY